MSANRSTTPITTSSSLKLGKLNDIQHSLKKINTAYSLDLEVLKTYNADAWKAFFKKISILNSFQVVTNEEYKKFKSLLNAFARENENTVHWRIVRTKKVDRSYDETQFQNPKYCFINNLKSQENTEYLAHELTKQKERISKYKISWVSTCLALSVAVGEGIAAAALLVKAAIIHGLHMALAVPIIGIPAGIVNFILFRGAAIGAIREISLGRMFYDENGDRISDKTFKKSLWTLGSSAAAGMCYGLLSIVSFLAMASNPAGWLIALGTLISLGTAASVTVLYFLAINDMIKNNACQKLKNYFRKTFEFQFALAYDPLKDDSQCRSWNELSSSEQYLHHIKKGITLIFNGLIIVLTGVVSSVFAFAAPAMFFGQGMSFFHSFCKMAKMISTIMSVLTAVLAVPLNTIFMINSIRSFFYQALPTLWALTKAMVTVSIFLIPMTLYGLYQGFKNHNWNTIRSLAHSFCLIFQIMNSFCQAVAGKFKSPIKITQVLDDKLTNQSVTGNINALSMGAGSGGAGIDAVNDTLGENKTGHKGENVAKLISVYEREDAKNHTSLINTYKKEKNAFSQKKLEVFLAQLELKTLKSGYKDKHNTEMFKSDSVKSEIQMKSQNLKKLETDYTSLEKGLLGLELKRELACTQAKSGFTVASMMFERLSSPVSDLEKSYLKTPNPFAAAA